MNEPLTLIENILILLIPIGFALLVKLFRSAENHAVNEVEQVQKELEGKVYHSITENHYHTHDNRTVNIIVKDGSELKTVLSKKANQTKLLGE